MRRWNRAYNAPIWGISLGKETSGDTWLLRSGMGISGGRTELLKVQQQIATGAQSSSFLSVPQFHALHKGMDHTIFAAVEGGRTKPQDMRKHELTAISPLP